MSDNLTTNPTLEGLPTELKISILKQIPDFTSLKALVQASSKYYRIYRGFQTEILFDLLRRQYDDQVDLVESLASVRSKGLWASESKNTEQIYTILDFRRRASREGNGKKYDTHGSLSSEELIRLLGLHKAAVFLLQDYSESIWEPRWWHECAHEDWKTAVLPIRFSHNERARFFRAFYRFRTWCNIFGQQEYYPSRPSKRQDEFKNAWGDKTFSPEDAWRLLWGTIPPWELEEVGCIWKYFELKYQQIFDEITKVLGERFVPEHPNQPRFIDSHKHGNLLPPGTPISKIDDLSDGSYMAQFFRQAMIEIGPYFLFKILQLPYEERQNAVANNLRTIYDVKMWDIAEFHHVRDDPLLSPADRYEREDIDDVISSFPILERPSQGLVKKWVYPSADFDDDGEFIENEDYDIACFVHEWDWGYALWDSERLRQWKAPALSVDDIEDPYL